MQEHLSLSRVIGKAGGGEGGGFNRQITGVGHLDL